MVINDNDREYDLDRLDDYSSMTQGIIKRLIYTRFVSIRNVLSDSSCNKLKANRILELIKDPNYINEIQKLFIYTDEEIVFYVNYAIQNFPMVR